MWSGKATPKPAAFAGTGRPGGYQAMATRLMAESLKDCHGSARGCTWVEQHKMSSEKKPFTLTIATDNETALWLLRSIAD
ncbi:hypothetical protein BaRGS_00029447 [Batillaria attramentaria]|uniref:Uncharacterized protein n=1 Tax=Batillaria attramentaria TaxID=370345 RepID=A0ABD0JWD3_9CAEN